ncbi:MAG TPA: PPK2 family polyphosphate kinase [Candidatus Limnocylindrales bacterium]|nr:PPK2 family polyphosphate kinase [Candidatus Limnocylindrales bacterium]
MTGPDPGSIPELLRIRPGAAVDLRALDPDSTPGTDGDKEAGRARLKELRKELADFQRRFWAEKKRSLLIVLQALDAGGKDGAIRKVFTAFNPQGTVVTGFGVPTEEELAHDYLWRVHARTPGTGRIGIFNRSHYEDVLVVRVRKLVPESVWRPRYEQINAFERTLAASGTVILKFFLHMSPDEQKARFEKRLENPDKRWKFSLRDLDVRKQWDEYRAAYEEALSRCSTDEAPWFAIPADHKWYRDLALAEIVAETGRRLDPQYPPPDEDLSGVVIA